MTSAVQDASAVLAVVREEPGTDKVVPHIGKAAISAVNLQEIVKELLLGGLGEPTIRDCSTNCASMCGPTMWMRPTQLQRYMLRLANMVGVWAIGHV